MLESGLSVVFGRMLVIIVIIADRGSDRDAQIQGQIQNNTESMINTVA